MKIIIGNDFNIFENSEYQVDSQVISFIQQFQQWLLSIKGKNSIQRENYDDPIYSQYGSTLLMYNGDDFDDISIRSSVRDEIERVFNIITANSTEDVVLNKEQISFDTDINTVKIIIPITFLNRDVSFSVDIFTGDIYIIEEEV